MDPYTVIALLLGVLFALLAAGVWVAVSLLIVGLAALLAFTSLPVEQVLSTAVWSTIASWPLTSLPLFIWMGEILFRTRLADDMFKGLVPWTGRLPGQLLHVNVIGCGIFAAVSGSSAATAATIGKITLPELFRRRYPEQVAIGSLAAGGTLGILIPPSIPMIVYGVAAQVSIAKLFIAGVIPGAVLMTLFSLYTSGWAMLHKQHMPASERRYTVADRVRALGYLSPVVLLIAAVTGSLYTGIATPTEAAAVGVLGALIVAAATRSLTVTSFVASVKGTVLTSCMIVFILAAASFLSTALAFLKLPAILAAWVSTLGLSPYWLLLALAILYLILGCFIDGISMVVLTAAIVLPMVERVGIDLLWFGVFIVILVEMANITPPVGFNLFVVQGITGRDSFAVALAAFPYFLIMCLFAAVITAFPALVTWLPNLAFR